MTKFDENGYIPPGSLTTTSGLLNWALRKSSEHNIFGSKNAFQARVLTEPIQADAYGQQTCMVRILDPAMAHIKLLRDPCDMSISSNPALTSFWQSLHTKMIVGPEHEGEGLHINATVEIILEPSGHANAPYDLQTGKFLKLVQEAKVTDATPTDRCISVVAGFADMTPYGTGAGTGDPGDCSWSGGAKAYKTTWTSTAYPDIKTGTVLENGLLEKTGMLRTDSTSGAQLIPPAMDDFLKLAAAYKTKFPGKTLKGSGYRPYALQEYARMRRSSAGNKCGSGEYCSGKFCGYAATPGRSNHGWGAAVDIDRPASGWTNGQAGNSPEFKWVNKFSQEFNFVFGVRNEHWHIDWMPFSRQTEVGQGIAATAQNPWTNSGRDDESITLT